MVTDSCDSVVLKDQYRSVHGATQATNATNRLIERHNPSDTSVQSNSGSEPTRNHSNTTDGSF